MNIRIVDRAEHEIRANPPFTQANRGMGRGRAKYGVTGNRPLTDSQRQLIIGRLIATYGDVVAGLAEIEAARSTA